MVDYRIVKYCGLCKVRFVVNKGENKKIYCETCYQKVLAYRKSEAEKEMNKPLLSNLRTCEWGIKFYSVADLEKLKSELSK